jgi:hypothetical protein
MGGPGSGRRPGGGKILDHHKADAIHADAKLRYADAKRIGNKTSIRIAKKELTKAKNNANKAFNQFMKKMGEK